MKIGTLSFMSASGTDWRSYSRNQIEKLHSLPATADHFSAHRPDEDVFMKAYAIIESIANNKMPLPFVAAGSDGSIELTWRRNPRRELSCFIGHDGIVILLMREGVFVERDLDEPNRINDYANGLFD